jgi:hypothetical protein
MSVKPEKSLEKPFWRYIFLCIVKALWDAYSEKTLAALPVGAIRIVFCFSESIIFTVAPSMVVLPVPAYPFRSKTLFRSPESRNPDKICRAEACSEVGSKGKNDSIFFRAKSAIIKKNEIILAIKIVIKIFFFIFAGRIKFKIQYEIIMKPVLRILLLVAIGVLVYMCIQSILTPIDFENQEKARKAVISERLIEIRNAQIGYKNAHGIYAANFEELQKFLNETKIPFLIKEGELTDEQLKSGMTEQEAVKKGIIRRDTNWVLAKDTLLGPGYDVASIGKVPGFENYTFDLDTATISSSSGYTVPVFQCAVPYDVYLGDLDKQLLFNLKEKMTKMNRYAGLRVGSVTEINNNAGNWEL